MVTVSVETQGVFEIVHTKMYVLPNVPLNPLVGSVAFTKTPPTPLKMLQLPIPISGVFAARVKEVNPQVAAPVWSGPAVAGVGEILNVIATVSVKAVQGALEMVHTKIYALPAIPLNKVVGLVASTKVPPIPLKMLQIPVPIAGVFAARLREVNPQVAALVWSGPAVATVAA